MPAVLTHVCPVVRAAQAEALAREVQCSLLLGATHVNIVQPHELLLTPAHTVLVTAYEAGGTLAGYCARNRVDEPTACYFFRQLVAALAHCTRRRWRSGT